ncbi:MAG: FMN-binding protein [Candidatus Cloacimonetes bacterium]|jgi:electron transport complex protein RnfG|nr:FMN-binding protein [Candidatus Cloacimonadota bacterium]MDD4155382.1 FMN-binding protein [Candidatus Cloacimonadota bacterium]
MKAFIQYGFTLFLIVAIACGILAWVNTKTAPKIAENLKVAEENARKIVFSDDTKFELVENEKLDFYKAYDINDNLIGYAFVASGKGYSSNVLTMVGVKTNFSVNKITILSQSETPGLGDNCKKPEFAQKYIGKNKSVLKVDKDGGEITSITGATITTRAVTNSIKQYIEILESIINEKTSGGVL